MKCPICKSGSTRRGTTTVTLQRDQATVVFMSVPAEVCDTCGEAFVDEAITDRLLADAEKAATQDTKHTVQLYSEPP